MEVLAKGQLSYLILACLEERDMYGLELIDEIKKRSGIEIKMPSLYSNINRMKELKYISSYLRESTKGPKCAYSSITENGRIELARLKEVFGDMSVTKEESVQPPVNDDQEEVVTIIHETPVECTTDLNTDKYDDYNEYFSIPEDNEDEAEEKQSEPEILEQKEEQVASEEKIEESVKLTPVQEKIDVPEGPRDGGVFLPREEKIVVNEETQRLYNASREYSSRANNKKISENQIGLVAATTTPLAREQAQIKRDENIGNLKQALLDSKQGYYEEVKLEETVEEPVKEDKHVDDGVFITDKVDYIPRSNRIEPPRLNILTTSEPKLPAPHRNVNIDPNHSDVKAKIESLYAKSQNNTVKEESNLAVGYDNYDDLKTYYESQNVTFKVFNKSEKKPVHNTNKITFFVELIMFGLISLGSGLLYLLFSKLGYTEASTDFLYYTIPLVYFVYVMVRLYYYLKVQSVTPRPLFNFIVVWGSFIILSGVTFAFNLINTPVLEVLVNSTTLFLPIFVFAMIFVVRHYILLFAMKKFWK